MRTHTNQHPPCCKPRCSCTSDVQTGHARSKSMTVVELIEILARYDPGTPVRIADAHSQRDATRFDVQLVDVPEADGGLAVCISPHDRSCARQVRPEVRCPSCGWVHVAIPLHHAEQSIVDVNVEHARSGIPAVETIERYLRCRRCGTASAGFTPAGPDDAPAGCTLPSVVVR